MSLVPISNPFVIWLKTYVPLHTPGWWTNTGLLCGRSVGSGPGTSIKEGKIKPLKDAKRWLNEQERVDAPQVAAKRWRAMKLQHDGKEICLHDWRDFRGQCVLTLIRQETKVIRLWRTQCINSIKNM